jgi:lipid-A-disaccharide synthase
MFTQFNERDLHPEFIQEEVTADNLIKVYEEYNRNQFLEDSKLLRGYLKHGSSKTVASIIEDKHED